MLLGSLMSQEGDDGGWLLIYTNFSLLAVLVPKHVFDNEIFCKSSCGVSLSISSTAAKDFIFSITIFYTFDFFSHTAHLSCLLSLLALLCAHKLYKLQRLFSPEKCSYSKLSFSPLKSYFLETSFSPHINSLFIRCRLLLPVWWHRIWASVAIIFSFHSLKAFSFPEPYSYSEYGPWASAESQVLSWTRIYILTRSPHDLYAHESLRKHCCKSYFTQKGESWQVVVLNPDCSVESPGELWKILMPRYHLQRC